jgi:hypothetical protein
MTEGRAATPGSEPERSVRAMLDDLVRSASAATGAAAEATVRVRRRDGDRGLAAVGDRAAACDGVGDRAGGAAPWRALLDEPGEVVLPDLAEASAWPGWRDAAVAAGFGSAVVVAAEVPRGGRVALSLSLDAPGAAGPAEVRRAAGFAGQVASLIALHSSIPVRPAPAPAVLSARRSRAGIEQAVGALMEVRGCPEDEARHVLAVLAAEQGRSVEAVAASVVEHAARSVRTARPAPHAEALPD